MKTKVIAFQLGAYMSLVYRRKMVKCIFVAVAKNNMILNLGIQVYEISRITAVLCVGT